MSTHVFTNGSRNRGCEMVVSSPYQRCMGLGFRLVSVCALDKWSRNLVHVLPVLRPTTSSPVFMVSHPRWSRNAQSFRTKVRLFSYAGRVRAVTNIGRTFRHIFALFSFRARLTLTGQSCAHYSSTVRTLVGDSVAFRCENGCNQSLLFPPFLCHRLN